MAIWIGVALGVSERSFPVTRFMRARGSPEMPSMRLFGHPVGSWGEAAGGEEHAESVVLAVAETASEAAV